MKLASIGLATLFGFVSIASANSTVLQTGESFVKARARLLAEGWRADPRAHLASGEYMGLDRLLVQSGYMEVDYCSAGKSFCTFQYTKGEACLRVQTQGEQIRSMKIEHWSNECREHGADEPEQVPPADVRYLVQWTDDCEKFGQCRGITAFALKLKKKYLWDREVMRILNAHESPVGDSPGPTPKQ